VDAGAKILVEALGLRPLPHEGGYYAETHRAVPPPALTGTRALSTAIYFLVTAGGPTALHRLASDEVFHFYLGDPVELLTLFGDGTASLRLLGPDIAGGQRPQAVVPAGAWQALRLGAGGRFALLGTTMAPGFDFEDYEAGEPGALGLAYPAFGPLLARWKASSPG
jgi:predicted cupin superfamily sugar epimerase